MNRDLAIIGAGPAGMAAAIAARTHGLSVAVFDEQPEPGGQIYRDILSSPAERTRLLGSDYAEGSRLADDFLASGADYHPRSRVWRLGADGVSWTAPTGGGECAAARVIVATGAMERPIPIPGWTLPGVMTAGAAQILLKTIGTVTDDAVFVGCGPLLYLIVAQYLKAGARIGAILDTALRSGQFHALQQLPQALRAPAYLVKGIGLLGAIRRANVRHHKHVRSLSIHGEDGVQSIRWEDSAGSHEMACRTVFLHQGIIPHPNAVMAAGAAQQWDNAQLSFRPILDRYCRSSLDWLLVAGDGGGIHGARAAALSGGIAGATAAFDIGAIDETAHRRFVAPLKAKHRREMAIRPFLDALYRPDDMQRLPSADDTIVCRCEEVRRRDIVAAVRDGCIGPNQLKSYTRAGMGPCQGRLCGHTVTEMIAELRNESAAAVGYYRIRMPLKPVTVEDVAGLAQQKET